MRKLRIADSSAQFQLINICRLAYYFYQLDEEMREQLTAMATALRECSPPCQVALPDSWGGEELAAIVHKAQLAVEGIMYQAVS